MTEKKSLSSQSCDGGGMGSVPERVARPGELFRLGCSVDPADRVAAPLRSVPHRTDESDAAAHTASLPSSPPLLPPSCPWLHIDVITSLTFAVFCATTSLSEPCTADFVVAIQFAFFVVVYLLVFVFFRGSVSVTVMVVCSQNSLL